MKNILIAIVSIFIISCNKDDEHVHVNSATLLNGEKVWSKTFGGSNDESIKSVLATSDGGFVIVGYTKSANGDITDAVDEIEDAWVTKYDAEGNLLWSKTYGGSLDDYGYSVVEVENGNLVVAGYSKSSDGDLSSNLGMHDFFVFKINSSGGVIWSKSYGYSSHDHAHKIVQTSDGGFFVVGFTDFSGGVGGKSIQHGVGEFYGLRLNANGDKLWDTFFGGTQNDRVYDVVQSNDGGFVMVGYSESNDFDATDNHGSYDYWVVKVNNLGDLVWKKSFGGSDLDQAYGIVKAQNNNYIVVGTSNSIDGDVSMSKGGNDVWVIAIDDFGNKIWEKSYGGTGYETANAIKKLNDGRFVVVGHTRSENGNVTFNRGENDVWVFVIDSGGNLNWQKTFGGSSFDFGYDATQLFDGTLVVVGDTQSNDLDISENKGMKDLFVIKIK